MPNTLKLESPFYRREIIERLLPQARSDKEALSLPEDALDSDELCEVLNMVLRESIEASLK
jgi:hypothetical protein